MADRRTPCPVCDLERHGACDEDGPFTARDAMALGVALGCCFQDPHCITKIVCERHRTAWVMSMVRASIAINTVEGEDRLDLDA